MITNPRLNNHHHDIACAERWHGEVDAVADALLATVLEQEATLGGLEPEQVLDALADVVALVVLGQPVRKRLEMLRRCKETLARHVNEEAGWKPLGGGRN